MKLKLDNYTEDLIQKQIDNNDYDNKMILIGLLVVIPSILAILITISAALSIIPIPIDSDKKVISISNIKTNNINDDNDDTYNSKMYIVNDIHSKYSQSRYAERKEYDLDEKRKEYINSKSYWSKKINGTNEKIKRLQSVEALYRGKFSNMEYEDIERNLHINMTDYIKQYDNSTIN